MNNCLNVEDIGKYLSEALDEKELKRVNEHLKICERCRDECNSIISIFEDDDIWNFDSINNNDAKKIMDKIYKVPQFDRIKKYLKQYSTLVNDKLKGFIKSQKNIISQINSQVSTARVQEYYPWSFSQNYQPCVVLARNNNHCERTNENIIVYKQFSSLKTEIFIERLNMNSIDLLINTVGKKKISNNTYVEIFVNNALIVRPIKDGYSFIEGLPFASYHMVLKKNSVFMGKYDFEITSQGLYEK